MNSWIQNNQFLEYNEVHHLFEAGFIQFLDLAFFWNLSMDLLLSLKAQCLLKLSKDAIKDEEEVHGEVFIEIPILPLFFFKNEQAILPRSQLIEEDIFVFVNGDVVKLDNECFGMLITKMRDLGVCGNARESVIEMEEKEAEGETLLVTTRTKSKSRAHHAEMMKWN